MSRNIKIVYFGRVPTVQVQCEGCKKWQFDDEFCGSCGFRMPREEGEVYKTEYRTDIISKRDRVPRKTKDAVFKRDKYVCQYCGIHCYSSWLRDSKAVTVDHIVPVTAGGMSKKENLITCCRSCNSIKGNRRFSTFEEARKYILNQYE